MNGIASLPQGSNMPQGGPPQAPGQAAPGQMPGIPMPQAQGTPMGIASDSVKQLTQLNDQMLMNLFGMSLSGQIKSPQPISILAAISQKNKEAAALEAVKRQMSQMQNAQNQQAGTVADQEISALQNRAQQPVMARHGGAMHSYRQGGIVGYANGGGATSYPVKDQEDVESLSVNERFKRTLDRLLGKKPEEGPRQWQERQRAGEGEPDLMGESLIPVEEADPFALVGGERLPAPPAPQVKPPAAPPVAPPVAPITASPVAPKARPQAETGLPKLLEEMDPYFKAERERLDAAGRPSADVIKAREAYDALMKEQAAARTAAAERRAKGIEALQERAARAGDISTSDLLLALGTGLLGAKTFSEGLGGAGQQLQGMRKAAAERTERAQERLERRQDLADQLAVKDAELARVEQAELVARATGDDKAAREAAAAKNGLLKERAGLLLKLEELGLERRKVAATEMQAQAAKTSAERPPKDVGLTPYQRAQMQDDATKRVMDDKMLPTKINNARAAAIKAKRPFDEQAFIDSLVREQYEKLMAAAEGRPVSLAAPAAGEIARPTTQAAFDALPKGARYINPSDGKEYIKN